MEESSIIKPNTVQKKLSYKFRVNYDNGAVETIFSIQAPQLDPQVMGFINFVIKQGNVKQVNLSKVRYMDVEISESVDMKIIT